MAEQFNSLLVDLPGYLSAHVLLVVVALGVGAAVSIPLAVVLTRSRRWQLPVLSTAGVIQTVPSLALLALMVPVFKGLQQAGVDVSASGFLPAVIALTLYSMLPMLRNTVAGIQQVDPAMVEAARGVGMTDGQRLMRVELPLAMPVILAGVRTATVWVVGIATLATPIGQECLGNYIFTGLYTNKPVMILWGVAWAAGLALALDYLIGAAQRSAQRGSRAGLSRCAAAAVVLLGLTLGLPGVVGLVRGEAETPGPAVAAEQAAEAEAIGTVVIGAKNFTEQYLLARVVELALRDAGYETERVESLGSMIVFEQLLDPRAGTVDVYIDYSGTLWANYLKREGGAEPWRVLAQTGGWLAQEHGVRQLGALGFENAYALAVPRGLAEELGVVSVADLAGHSGGLSIAGSAEFFERPEWLAIESRYGLAFNEERVFSPTLMYEAASLGEVDVIAAFSSDGRIAAYDLVVLDEPANVIPPYDATLLLGPRVAGYAGFAEALGPLVGAISLEQMQRANEAVDVDGKSLDEAARGLYESIVER